MKNASSDRKIEKVQYLIKGMKNGQVKKKLGEIRMRGERGRGKQSKVACETGSGAGVI
jgi:hypothetical protein